jgi:beta-mannosidase
MFACAMYPGDKDFLENVKQEAIDNVKRLRHHASIALWCGNNENSEGWRRWGWQADRSEEEKEEIWSNYLKVFDSILPNTIARLTDANYWETSPKYGRGNPKYNSEGDAHDWWIWHDGYPFEHLEENVPRFMSEFGFQSLPSYETIRYINQNDSIDISSEGFKNHQKHARGFQIMEDYMKRDFPVPDDSEDYVYMSQLLQAYGITKGIEAQRRAKPYNMGTLFWQLNDCWPAVSWSSIDYFGNWKALHYKAKKAFENVLVSNAYDRSQGILNTTLINDGLLAITDTLKIRVVDFDGNEYYRLNKLITVGKDHNQHSNLKLYEHDRATSRSRMVVSTFASTTRYFYFEKPKNLFLKQKPIESEIIKTDHGFNIKLSSTTLQKDVFLFTKESGHFSDNFFDLLPNETITIYFKTKVPTLDDLQLKSFNSFIR